MSLSSCENVLLANQPPNMAIQLTDSQRAMIYQMELLENTDQIETKSGRFIYSRFGFNVDPPEKGPIQSMVGLLCRNKQNWPMDEEYKDTRIISLANGLYRDTVVFRTERLDTSLVLVSNSTVQEWLSTLTKTTLRFIVISKLSYIENMKISDYDVIVCTAGLYNTLNNLYRKFTWKRLIISNPCDISIPDMARCSAGYYWLVTDNPLGLVSRRQNNTNRLIKDIVGSEYDFDQKYEGLILKSKIT